jgi:hypothetical protein
MKITCFLNTAAGFKREYIREFGLGIEKTGDKVYYHDKSNYVETDVAIIFAFKSAAVTNEMHKLRQSVFDSQKNKKIFFIDSNVFKQYEKIIYHRYPFKSIFPHEAEYFIDKLDLDKWSQIKKDSQIDVKDYKQGDDILLLLNRGETGFSTQGNSAWDWAFETISQLKKYTDRKIKIRPHKINKNSNDTLKIKKIKDTFKDVEILTFEKESLLDSLKNTWACVLFSTTAGMPSLIEGVPIFVTSPTSVLYEMTSGNLENIESPKLHDRLSFLQKVSKQHWTQKEILNGSYWSLIKKHI